MECIVPCERCRLLDRQLRMSSSDGLSRRIRQGIQEAVVGVHGGKLRGLELVVDDGREVVHALLKLGPVAHHVKRVHEVAEDVPVFAVQAEGRLEVLDGLGVVAKVFANARKVVVVVG